MGKLSSILRSSLWDARYIGVARLFQLQWENQNAWLAINPIVVIGEREFDIPFPRLEKIIDEKLLRYRRDQFIEISGFDQQ